VACPAAVLGFVAPDGMLVNHTLWGARLSLSTKTTVDPDATVMLDGEKFLPEPAPCGIVTVTVAPLPLDVVLVEVVDVVLVLVVLVVEVVEVTAVPVTTSLPCIHPGWNWHS